MVDNVAVTAGSGTTIAADEVVDGTLGTVKVQYIKLMDGTLDGINKATVKAASTAAAATDPALVVGLSPNGVTRGAGAADSSTLRVTMDSGQIGALGQTTMSASVPTAPASDWVGTTALGKFGTGYYVACPASATTTLQSTTGATGDYISGVLIIPGSTSPSSVALLDNVTSMTIFAGGATSVSNLVPFFVPLGAVSRSGAWKITTGGTNVTCLAIGKFS